MTTLILVGLVATVVGQPSVEQGQSQPKAPVLEDVMENIGGAQRKLRRQLGDPAQNPASLELVQGMQKGVMTATTMSPAKTAKLPKAQQPRFLLAYKRQMVQLMIGLLDLEAALLDGDNDKAKLIYKKIGAIKKAGHEQFQEPEEPTS